MNILCQKLSCTKIILYCLNIALKPEEAYAEMVKIASELGVLQLIIFRGPNKKAYTAERCKKAYTAQIV